MVLSSFVIFSSGQSFTYGSRGACSILGSPNTKVRVIRVALIAGCCQGRSQETRTRHDSIIVVFRSRKQRIIRQRMLYQGLKFVEYVTGNRPIRECEPVSLWI